MYIFHTFYRDVTVNHCKTLLHAFQCTLGTALKYKQYSGITVENWTPVKSVKTTLNIYLQCRICKLQMSFLPTGLPPTQPTEFKKKKEE